MLFLLAKHPGVEEIVECEIDEGVINVSKKYLPSLAKGYDDPRVTVKIMDGAKFMEENEDSFDVIITDSSDRTYTTYFLLVSTSYFCLLNFLFRFIAVGPASVLFETPFYNAMYKSLREGGIVCTQGECMWLHLHLIKPLIDSITEIYASVEYAYTTIPTYPSGQIGFIIATKGRGECKKPERKPSDDVQENLQYYTPELHEAAFVLPAFAKRAIFGGK
jgi:spermidine synthase